MKLLQLLILTFFFQLTNGYSQYFLNTYSSSTGYLYSVNSATPTPDHGILITTDNISSTTAQALIKLDSSGTIQWNKLITRSDGLEILTAAPISTYDGNMLICNVINKYNLDSVSLIKMDTQGNIIWSKIYSNYYGYGFHSLFITETFDHGYIISNNSYLIKVDSIGDLLWAKNYNISYNNRGSVLETSDSGCIFLVWKGIGSPNTPIGLVKCDKNGLVQWSKNYSDTNNFWITSIAEVSTGYVFAKGPTLISVDFNGDTLWTKTYSLRLGRGTSNSIFFIKIAGGLILTYQNEASGSYYNYICQTDSLGNIIWTRRCIDPSIVFNHAGIGSLHKYLDGYLLAGDRGPSGGPSDSQPIIIKTDSVGYWGCPTDAPLINTVHINISYFTDTTTFTIFPVTVSIPSYNITTMILGYAVNCFTLNNNDVLVKSVNIYPNPSTGLIFIDDIDSGSTISIYDLFGRLIYNNVKTHDKRIDLTLKKSGVYVCKITSGQNTSTSKFIVQQN